MLLERTTLCSVFYGSSIACSRLTEGRTKSDMVAIAQSQVERDNPGNRSIPRLRDVVVTLTMKVAGTSGFTLSAVPLNAPWSGETVGKSVEKVEPVMYAFLASSTPIALPDSPAAPPRYVA